MGGLRNPSYLWAALYPISVGIFYLGRTTQETSNPQFRAQPWFTMADKGTIVRQSTDHGSGFTNHSMTSDHMVHQPQFTGCD